MTDYIPIDDKYCSRPLLLCPICGFECIHPIGIECLPPGTPKGRVLITSDGLMVDPHAEPDGRGVRITLYFECESHHKFAYRFHFHKGHTFFEQIKWRPTPESESADTIWRN
jgi:hypothetical protein